MAAYDQLMWLSVFVALIVLARVLISRPALRVLTPWVERAVARLDRPEDIDPEAEEMALYLRRQRLVGHLDRVRRILANDEWMPATRQVGNRLAYASLVHDIAQLPEVYAPPTSLPAPQLIRRDERRGPSVEVLDVVGWGR